MSLGLSARSPTVQDLVDDAPDVGRLEGLAERGRRAPSEELGARRPERIAGDEDHTTDHLRVSASHLAVEPRPVEVRHLEIADDEIVTSGVELVERRHAVIGRRDPLRYLL